MDRAIYLLRLTGEDIDGSTVSCLGEQLKLILQQLETLTFDCIWLAADVDAHQNLPITLVRGLSTPTLVGDTNQLIDIVEKVDQFQSGVFIAIPKDTPTSQWPQILLTEDDPFRDIGKARFEIRAFDTTYFEVYARNSQLLQEKFKSKIMLNNL